MLFVILILLSLNTLLNCQNYGSRNINLVPINQQQNLAGLRLPTPVAPALPNNLAAVSGIPLNNQNFNQGQNYVTGQLGQNGLAQNYGANFVQNYGPYLPPVTSGPPPDYFVPNPSVPGELPGACQDFRKLTAFSKEGVSQLGLLFELFVDCVVQAGEKAVTKNVEKVLLFSLYSFF